MAAAPVASSSAAPFTAAVPALARSPGGDVPAHLATARTYWTSDSAKEGTRTPGVGGVTGGCNWVRPFTTRELQIPIAVTEFIGHPGNFLAFGARAPAPMQISSEFDALATVADLHAGKANSDLMRHVYNFTLALPGYAEFASRHSVAHLFGPGNVLADLISRGYIRKALDLMAQLGLKNETVPYPPELDTLLSELCDMCERNQALQPAALAPTPARGTPLHHGQRGPPRRARRPSQQTRQRSNVSSDDRRVVK